MAVPIEFRESIAQPLASPALLVKVQTGRNTLAGFLLAFSSANKQNIFLPMIGDYVAFTQLL